MSIVLWAGTGVGVVFGLLHAGYIYRLGVREAPAARGFLATHGRAVYDALWALGLWLLFGTYVLVLWVIGVFFYAIHKLRRPVGPAVSRPEPGPDEAGQTPAMDLAGVEKVAIIGAGVAGLSTAKTLMAEGVDCTLFERGAELGGVWAIGYSNFGVQVQRELYEFPDWPLPKDTPDFTPGEVIQAYLADYARHFGIMPHIRFGTGIERLERREGGQRGWIVHHREGENAGRDEFDLVVVCTGLYSSQPNMPEYPERDAFGGEVMHVSGLESRDQLAGKKVVVVGYGKSATDAALESAAVAAETTIVFRAVHWPVPRKLAGILPFKWGMLNRLTNALIPPYQRPSGLERWVHGLGRPLVWLYWRLVELLLIVQCRLGSRFGRRVGMVPEKPVEIDAFGESTMLPRPEFPRLVRKGVIAAEKSEIARYTPTGVALANGREIEADVVVLGTGWRTDFGYLPDGMLETIGFADDGFYLYRHVLHPGAPDIAFIGRASTVLSILTYGLQARWLAELVKGRFALPGREAMLDEIEGVKEWKRSWMPHSAGRGARLILHMQHYHDELLRDIGANPRRKRGVFAPLKELIAPYEPRDYRSIVSGDWAAEELRPAEA